MENNTLINGRIHQQTTAQRFRSDRSKKAPPELPAVETRNWLLHRHYTRHEYRICKILIEEELKKYAEHSEYPNYLKGLILRKEGKIQDSLDCFQKCYNVNPNNVNNAKQIAKSLFLLADHKRAIEVFLEAQKMTYLPDWEIHYNLGECYTRTKQLENAKTHLIRATELTRNENPYVALVQFHVAENRIIDATTVYTEAISDLSESEQIATELGLLYLRLGDTKRAFQRFGTALAQSANYGKATLPMAYVMQTHGELDVAFSKYKIAALSMPESWALWNNIGMCLYGKQKYVSAITCLKRAHYLNPMALPAASNLGIVYLATGQPASAAIYLCAAISAGPKNPEPYLLLAIALKRLEDLEGAEKALEKAHLLAPQNPLILINYAVVLDARHKYDQAREVLIILSDVAALTVIETQVSKMAKQLATKLQSDGTAFISTHVPEERILTEDEV